MLQKAIICLLIMMYITDKKIEARNRQTEKAEKTKKKERKKKYTEMSQQMLHFIGKKGY